MAAIAPPLVEVDADMGAHPPTIPV
ncbi:hypothetical protein L195_g013853, partial [Trifolium pratense]